MPLQRCLKITNEVGLHARPASLFVHEAQKYEAAIEVRKVNHAELESNEWTNAKSILGILGLGVSQHQEIEIKVEGVDEEEALAAIEALVKSGFAQEQER
jgi:phosphocarrier protein